MRRPNSQSLDGRLISPGGCPFDPGDSGRSFVQTPGWSVFFCLFDFVAVRSNLEENSMAAVCWQSINKKPMKLEDHEGSWWRVIDRIIASCRLLFHLDPIRIVRFGLVGHGATMVCVVRTRKM